MQPYIRRTDSGFVAKQMSLKIVNFAMFFLPGAAGACSPDMAADIVLPRGTGRRLKIFQ